MQQKILITLLSTTALVITATACRSFFNRSLDPAVSMNEPRSSANVTEHTTLNDSNTTVRIPAEWEPHAATWMQWPRDAEASLRQNFSAIIDEERVFAAGLPLPPRGERAGVGQIPPGWIRLTGRENRRRGRPLPSPS